MRIIGGILGGRRLKAMKGPLIRPTADRVKEAVFGILGKEVVAGRVLDLCAGTGALGLEALSRGASFAVFVDKHPRACRLVEENLRGMGFADRGEIRCRELHRAVTELAKEGSTFDLLFFDPPYGEGMIGSGVAKIGTAGLIHPEGVLVVEAGRHETVPWPPEFVCRRTERYGETMVYFLRRRGDPR